MFRVFGFFPPDREQRLSDEDGVHERRDRLGRRRHVDRDRERLARRCRFLHLLVEGLVELSDLEVVQTWRRESWIREPTGRGSRATRASRASSRSRASRSDATDSRSRSTDHRGRAGDRLAQATHRHREGRPVVDTDDAAQAVENAIEQVLVEAQRERRATRLEDHRCDLVLVEAGEVAPIRSQVPGNRRIAPPNPRIEAPASDRRSIRAGAADVALAPQSAAPGELGVRVVFVERAGGIGIDSNLGVHISVSQTGRARHRAVVDHARTLGVGECVERLDDLAMG